MRIEDDFKRWSGVPIDPAVGFEGVDGRALLVLAPNVDANGLEADGVAEVEEGAGGGGGAPRRTRVW